jgi:hypothetical protein
MVPPQPSACTPHARPTQATARVRFVQQVFGPIHRLTQVSVLASHTAALHGTVPFPGQPSSARPEHWFLHAAAWFFGAHSQTLVALHCSFTLHPEQTNGLPHPSSISVPHLPLHVMLGTQGPPVLLPPELLALEGTSALASVGMRPPDEAWPLELAPPLEANSPDELAPNPPLALESPPESAPGSTEGRAIPQPSATVAPSEKNQKRIDHECSRRRPRNHPGLPRATTLRPRRGASSGKKRVCYSLLKPVQLKVLLKS